MKLFITDVSVLFDLFHLKVLPEFFALNIEICTTIFVYNEILQSEQKELFEVFERSKRLTIFDFSEEEDAELRLFQTKLANRSINDKSIVWKAIQLKANILTCDAKLKKEAEHHKIEVHGSVWVVVELAKQGVIEKQKAIELLELLKTVNTRLPMEEIDKIIQEFKKTKH